TRLIGMGVDPFSFADAMLGTLAQRLARRLCRVCRVSHPASADEIAALRDAGGGGVALPDEVTLWSAPGCDACRRTGYAGRIALHELLVANDELKQAIQHKAPAAELRRLAVAGGLTQ